VLDGQPASFDIFYRNTIKTNGGHMFDLTITYQARKGTGLADFSVFSSLGPVFWQEWATSGAHRFRHSPEGATMQLTRRHCPASFVSVSCRTRSRSTA
jgi:hypothetical protein